MSFHFAVEEIKSHSIAIISLIIAITALVFTTWREEESEQNRTTRMAAFEVLKHLGELQIIVNSAYYKTTDMPSADPFVGWGHLSLIADMAELLPVPISEEIKQLETVWSKDWKSIKDDESAVNRITTEIDNSRNDVVKVIRDLR